MRTLILAVASLTAVSLAPARDVKETFALLKSGWDLSATEAGKLEARLVAHPKDSDARIKLLAYYAAPPSDLDLAVVKVARARHILWVIENDPKEQLGLRGLVTGVMRLNCRGDALADAESGARAVELWMAQAAKHRKDADFRYEAVQAIQYCAADKAEQLLIEADDRAGLGRLYSFATLGVTGASYSNRDPAGADPALRSTPFAVKAREILEKTTDQAIVSGAVRALLYDGGILWADGKLDWDYTPLGKRLLDVALRDNPDDIMFHTLSDKLPKRGQRPPATIRVGGNVMQAKLLRSVPPEYPPLARNNGVQGTVQMTALIGLDGKIVRLHADSGPDVLVPAALRSAAAWEYRPTLLNGQPCFVITRININFVLN